MSDKPAATLTAAPIAIPTDAAKMLRRLAYTAIEDAYDEGAKRYKAGATDETIAKDVGCSAKLIGSIRDEFFGPAAPPEPPEVTALRSEIAENRADAERIEREAAAATRAVLDRTIALENRMAAICKAGGWTA